MNAALIRNCLMAALRNMAGSPLQSAIAIGSLALGLWAAILAGVIAANQTGYDRFVPGSGQIYMPTFQGLDNGGTRYGGGPPRVSSATPHDLAGYLRGFPEVRDVTRLANGRGTFSQGERNNREEFYWADPNFFALVRLPALYGDPAAALQRPDGLVVTRAMARKYFGRDDARGGVLTLNHKTAFVVRAVIVDSPTHGSNFVNEMYLSALSSDSSQSSMAGRPGMGPQAFMMSVTTLARLADGARVEDLDRKTTALVAGLMKGMSLARTLFVRFVRLDAIQLSPELHPANRDRLEIFVAISALVLLLACINFVSLSLARSMRRAVEVGIRKAAGAGRGLLVAQFLGETVLQALFALCAAMALAEWSLPLANSYMQSGAVFPWWRDPQLLAALLGGTMLVGMAAGIYPALVLSGFRPAPVLKGLMLRGSATGTRIRQGLVALQFAIPLALVIAAIVVFQQDRFAATEALRLDTDQMLMINQPVCGAAFDAEIAALPGVADSACSGPSLLPSVMMVGDTKSRGGQPFQIVLAEVGFGFFRVYHLPALAGRLPDPAHPGDAVPARQQSQPAPGQGPGVPPPANRPKPPPVHYVINEAAVRALGYASPADAIGKPLPMNPGMPFARTEEIIGVVRDFSLYPPLETMRPTAYKTATDTGGGMRSPGFDGAALHVRLKGREIPETLAAIDTIWKRHSQDPINRIFLDAFVQQRQIDVLRQGQAFAAFAGVAALLACLGLFGLSLAATGQRIKEIGVRKAMGAENRQIVALLLWQFSRPVLLANLIAWPAAFWLMRRWLAGFPYQVELQWWVFAAGSAAMLTIALATVAGQALAAARQKPVLALRYE